MIYELRNKIPQNATFLRSEDVLTSTIFGNLRYFSNNDILNTFLSKSIDIHNKPLSLKNEKYLFKFWEKYLTKGFCKINEPDLILLNEKSVIIIECKYFSFLSEESDLDNKDVYDNQLLRYSDIINEYYSNRANKIIIFLTSDKVKPIEIMENTLKKLTQNIQLYWLSYIGYHILVIMGKTVSLY